jgi:hypothetical protein
MNSLHDYFTAGFDPIGLMPESKDTRESGWNAPTRPRTATPYHDNGNIGLRTGVIGTAPNGVLVDVDDDAPEASRVSDLLFPPTNAIFGRASKPRSHRMYVCTGDVPPAIKLDGLGGDDDTICELRTRTKDGKALQSVVPSSVWKSRIDGHTEVVVLDMPTSRRRRRTARFSCAPRISKRRPCCSRVICSSLAATTTAWRSRAF